MAVLSTNLVTPTGNEVTYVAADAGGDTVRASATTFISVRNDGGASVTVTVNDVGSKAPSGATAFDPDLTVVVAPSMEKVIGPLPVERFGNSSRNAEIEYSGVTDVTVAAIKV